MSHAAHRASSEGSFFAALVSAGITVGALTTVWLVLHNRKGLKKVFQPRAELAPEGKRPETLPGSPIGFWRVVLTLPDKELIVANGPDAYFFVRYLKVFGLQMMVPYVILTIAICVPVAVVKPNSGKSGLNKVTFGNIAASDRVRQVAHFIVAIVLMSWTLYLLLREYKHLVEIRQEWLASPQHLSLARTRTIALGNLPSDAASIDAIKEQGGVVSRLTGAAGPRSSNVTDGTVVAGNGPSSPGGDSEEETASAGGIRQIWIAKQCQDIEQVWQDRDDEVGRLEAGSSKLAKLANKNQAKGKTPEKKGQYDEENSDGSIADRFVLPKKQPTWKQGFLGLIGQKMDLKSSPEFIAKKNDELEKMRGDEDNMENGNTAFVRFGSQTEAHAFARLISSTDKKYRMIDSNVEVVPEDVQWQNISMSAIQRKLRTIVSWALTIVLIIFWAVPVGFVGVVSNLSTLCSTAPWLAWVCDIPAAARSIIEGVLPPALLAILFMLLPIVLRLFISLQGEILGSNIEYILFTRFWLFQVIQGFLVVTLASGLVSALSNINGLAAQVPTLLATKLPDASIFFLTYILVSTFTSAAKAYSRAIPTVMLAVQKILPGATPRKAFVQQFKMKSYEWATAWPPMCLIVVITIVYSVIQPIMTILTILAFCFLYAAHKYLVYWTVDQPDSLETGGLFYVKALRTVFVGLYLEGVCLAGLFFLSQNAQGQQATSGLVCGALMVAMIVIVACVQIYIDWFRFKKDYILYAHSSTTVKHSMAQKGFEQKGQAGAHPEEEDDMAGPQLGNTSGYHQRAFDHPALWKKQPVVWLPEDPLGIGKFESARINEAGVESSTEYASMNEKGVISVERGPPDEAWYGGYTAAQ